MYSTLDAAERRAKTREPALASSLPISVADITTPTVLICSHGQRDSRCGVLGPLLHREFAAYIDGEIPERAVAQVGPFAASAWTSQPTSTTDRDPAAPSPIPINVGTISHVGGHKWAGNVIVYVPPNAEASASTHAGPGQSQPQPQPHPLAGKGIWYGRVEPRHVQGIVEETVLRGRVIRELFRGGIDGDGKVIRL